ncbi:hypothetical protein UFOVP1290_425 [uncultured Caudovirales phage]|uniref:Uncharacterized protein n=1 Tax=uncultured Caudovirales phage TaxID=2100421 RepID=A0A6J5RXD0_9CAUD|nr:hypothetical protein UFOVP1290_425 [uncultured Caudovirales phage]
MKKTDGAIWKEEFYLNDRNIVMINEVADEVTEFYSIGTNKKLLSVPRINYTNKIKEKVQKYILFS